MPGNCPVVGIISHCLKKYISIHRITCHLIKPLHLGALSSKGIHDPFISLLWNLWSLMLLMLCAILKATQQHLTLMLRKYSAWVEWTPPVWSFTSCICEIRKLSCSSPLSDRYFSRIPLKFDFPNLDRHRFAQNDLFVCIQDDLTIRTQKVKSFNTDLFRNSSKSVRLICNYANPFTCTPPDNTSVKKLDWKKKVWTLPPRRFGCSTLTVLTTFVVILLDWK